MRLPRYLARPDYAKLRHWMTPSPEPIELYPGEKQILRTGAVLVTDTRLSYIDAFDRMLKTYMFEHMIRMDKKYYRPNTINRRLCKGLILGALIMLLLIIIVDIIGDNDRALVFAYVPVLLSLGLGLLVWRDMRPRFAVEWEMINGTTDKIAIEPLFREWISGNHKREKFMNELSAAMNKALSGKAWWPSHHRRPRQQELFDSTSAGANLSQKSDDNADQTSKPAPGKLTLVTDLYQY